MGHKGLNEGRLVIWVQGGIPGGYLGNFHEKFHQFARIPSNSLSRIKVNNSDTGQGWYQDWSKSQKTRCQPQNQVSSSYNSRTNGGTNPKKSGLTCVGLVWRPGLVEVPPTGWNQFVPPALPEPEAPADSVTWDPGPLTSTFFLQNWILELAYRC